MVTMYYVTRQTTTSGTAMEVKSVTGKDEHEALLNAKIKAYRAMETFKNEKTMVSAFVGVTNLVDGIFYIYENWVAEPQTETAE